MPDEDEGAARARLERAGRLVEADAQTRRVISVAFRIKPDDDEAFAELAEMFARHRDRGKFWDELRGKSVHGIVVALLTAAALWVFNRYAGRL